MSNLESGDLTSASSLPFVTDVNGVAALRKVSAPNAASFLVGSATPILSVRYVQPGGDDTSDGQSIATAKQTIIAAIEDLGEDGGTVYVADQSEVGGTVADQGIWLVGSDDPNYATPPAGFIQLPRNLKIVGYETVRSGGNSAGVGGAQIRGFSATDDDKPAIWLAGSRQSLAFENIVVRNSPQSLRVGIATDGTRDIITARITFRDCAFDMAKTATSGPNVDIGYAFWIWFDHCEINGNDTQPVGSDERAAIRIMPGSGGRSAGLIELDDIQLAGGGIIHEPGGTAWSLGLRNVFMEPGGGATQPHTALFRNAKNYGTAKLRSVFFADAPSVDGFNVRIEPSTTGDPASAENFYMENVPDVWGPATLTVADLATNYASDKLSPATMRQRGTWAQQRALVQQDSSRRQFGLVPVRFANLASHDPSDWPTSGSGTFTGGFADPTGNSEAVRVTDGPAQMYRQTLTASAGDFVACGFWARRVATDGSTFNAGQGTNVVGAIGFNPAQTFEQEFGSRSKILLPLSGDGEWEWVWTIIELDVGVSTEVIFEAIGDATGIDVFNPVMLVMPGATVSRNEAHELAIHMQTQPGDGLAAPVGSLATRQPVAFGSTVRIADRNGDLQTLQGISGFTVTNDTAARTLDADTATLAELSDVVATLIKDLGGTA